MHKLQPLLAPLPARVFDTALATALACVLLGAAGCSTEPSIDGPYCHGVDDGVACDDLNPCTYDDKCGDGVCAGLSHIDGTSCDDEDDCTIDDECMSGVCGGLDVCSDDAGDDDATVVADCATAADGALCDDGDLCTGDDACASGECVGAAVDCSASDESCRLGSCDAETGDCVLVDQADGSACEDGNSCTEGETCVSLVCGGGTFVADGGACDDGDADTFDDICDAGVCAGTPLPCDAGCCDADDDTPCDDGDACTAEDKCVARYCVGTTVEIDCSGDDSPCFEGRCDPATGGCVAVALANGEACDDGDPCTPTDVCDAATCVGVPLDCSGLDGECVAGVCEGGDCVAKDRALHMPCDDGDPCTGHDECDSGECSGGVDLCAACEGMKAGDACDDGDPCTPDAGICAQVSGGLRCDATPRSCAEISATCNVATCFTDDEECHLVAMHDGFGCDDGNSCTAGDSCQGGVCVGVEPEVCMGDAEAGFCEPGATNDTLATAIPLDLLDGPLVVRGALETESDIDWYALAVPAGRVVDAITAPHCGSDFQTLISIVRPGGDTLLVTDSATGWAEVIGDQPGGEGLYYVGVSRLSSTEDSTNYLLTVDVREAPACEADADCMCSRLSCETPTGATEGSCVPAIPAELEPNDKAGEATALTVALKPEDGAETVDEPALGRIATTSDQDWFVIHPAPAVQQITVTTTTSCDDAIDDEPEALDTVLRLYASDGTTELAFADAGADGADEARISDFVLPEPGGTYYVRVTGGPGALGAYDLTVTQTGCQKNSDCVCPDQKCSDPSGTGVCIPVLTAGEPSDVDGSGAGSVDLLLDTRLHSQIDPPYDADAFALTLGEGTYDIRTASYCGASLDTLLTVWDDSGDEPVMLAEDDDSGDERFALVTGLTIESATQVRVVVNARGGAVGDYIVVVESVTP